MTQAATALQFASALSTSDDTLAALEAVTAELRDQIKGPADLAVAFATPHHVEKFPALGKALADRLEARVALAVTAQGVLGVGREIEQGPGLSVLAASLPGALVQPLRLEVSDWANVIQSPALLHDQAAAQPAPAVIMLMADPFTTPQQQLLDAFSAAYPATPLVGGMASGAQHPNGNRLLVNNTVYRDGAVGVAIAGDIRADTTVSQGCRPVGKPFVITKAQGHVIQEIGGRNALAAVREMVEALANEDRQLVAGQALFVGRVTNEYKDRFGRGDFLIRNLIGVDQDKGWLAVSDPHIRVGQTIQFQVRDGKAASEDFSLLLEAQKLHGDEGGALLFTCNGRGSNMFDRPSADAEMIRQALGGIPLAGFFAMGEIGPIGGHNYLHGHTASLVVLRPKG